MFLRESFLLLLCGLSHEVLFFNLFLLLLYAKYYSLIFFTCYSVLFLFLIKYYSLIFPLVAVCFNFLFPITLCMAHEYCFFCSNIINDLLDVVDILHLDFIIV